VAYKEPALDPSDLALDMIDYVTQNRRAARVFNCNSAVVMAGPAVLYLVNYGRPQDLPVESAENIVLAVNLKTAASFGLTVPQTVLFRADVIRR